jgi:hypothetical protein
VEGVLDPTTQQVVPKDGYDPELRGSNRVAHFVADRQRKSVSLTTAGMLRAVQYLGAPVITLVKVLLYVRAFPLLSGHDGKCCKEAMT